MTEKDDIKKQIPTFDHDVFSRRIPGQDKGEERSRKDSDTMVSNTYRPPPPPPVKKSD